MLRVHEPGVGREIMASDEICEVAVVHDAPVPRDRRLAVGLEVLAKCVRVVEAFARPGDGSSPPWPYRRAVRTRSSLPHRGGACVPVNRPSEQGAGEQHGALRTPSSPVGGGKPTRGFEPLTPSLRGRTGARKMVLACGLGCPGQAKSGRFRPRHRAQAQESLRPRRVVLDITGLDRDTPPVEFTAST